MELCIMGAGLEARTHIDAMLAVRKIAKVRSRSELFLLPKIHHNTGINIALLGKYME
jgi:hypothetical protein